MDRVERIKEMLLSHPGDSFLQHALALEYIRMNDDVRAKELFENLLKENENYIGSYYHLGKVLERLQREDEAKGVYEKGMRKSKEAGDMHTYNELQAAYEDLVY